LSRGGRTRGFAYLFFVAFFFAAFFLGGGAERSTLGFGIVSPHSV
jgi:hypothetical protein